MVSLCGSNLIPILITILCCAGLFMYFNLRLSEIKSIVEKQNRVLTSFITNVQQEIKGGGSIPQPSHSLATPEALTAAKRFETERVGGACVSGDKIVVSDDEEDYDDDDDDDDDSETESDTSDSECEAEDTEDIKNIKIDVQEIQVENRIPIPISFEVLSYVLSDSSAQSSANESSITEIIDEPTVEEIITEDTIKDDTIKDDAIKEEPIATDEHYEQLKVDELRKVVSDKNLATKEEVKKLKKPELLVLLKK